VRRGGFESGDGEEVFLPRFNRRFAIPPRESEKAWRKVPPELDLDRMISFR
jgi:hypothetical protein